MDPDPDPTIFVIDLQDANKKLLKKKIMFITFWKCIFILFQRQKVKKTSQNSRNQGFSYYFCLMIEGSILWSRIRIQEAQNIRIRNTGLMDNLYNWLGPAAAWRPADEDGPAGRGAHRPGERGAQGAGQRGGKQALQHD
jgi:hypothetical protein